MFEWKLDGSRPAAEVVCGKWKMENGDKILNGKWRMEKWEMDGRVL